MSSTQDLQWLLTRKTSCFLVKQKGLARVFSREPNNLAQIHSYRYSGLVNDKNVSIEASKSGKGLVVSTKKADVAQGKIAGSRTSQSLKRDLFSRLYIHCQPDSTPLSFSSIVGHFTAARIIYHFCTLLQPRISSCSIAKTGR